MLQRLKKERIRAGLFAILFNASWVFLISSSLLVAWCAFNFLRFQMTPTPLIQIEIRRVRRQVEQLLPFLAGDESLHTFGDVWACLICNHKDLSFRIFSEQLFEEVNEYCGIDFLRWNLKKQSTLQAQSAHD